MRTDKPKVELVIRAKDKISHEQARAITLAANMGASVSIYLDKKPEGTVWKLSLNRADYVEAGGVVLKDRSGQFADLDKDVKITNY